jgi:PncC family amidohydrolase
MQSIYNTARIIGKLLQARAYTLATAESCTGGMVGQSITAVAGSSAYYSGGVIAYANKIKEEVLSVSPLLLQTYGAVSEEVARAMAEGVRSLFKVDCSLSVTGIAGPGGGTSEKPVGLVYFCCVTPEKVVCLKNIFEGSRRDIRVQTVRASLQQLAGLL